MRAECRLWLGMVCSPASARHRLLNRPWLQRLGKPEVVAPLSALPRLIPKIIVPVAVPMPMPRMSGARPQTHTQAGDNGMASMPRVDLHLTNVVDGVSTPEKTLENILKLQRLGSIPNRIA